MMGISEREQRLVALAVLVGFVTVVWLGLLAPLLSGFDNRQVQRARAQVELSRSARLLVQGPQLRTALKTEEQAVSAAAFKESSKVAAFDAARDRLISDAQANDLRLTALHNLSSPPSEVRLDADVHGDLGQIASFIQRLENATPFASIDQLVINSVEAPPGDPEPPLEARIVVAFGKVAPAH